MITRARPSGRCTAIRLADNPTVTIVRYLYFPFCVRTIVWIDRPSRAGFLPYRWRAVRDSLSAHGWQVDLQTKSWRTAIPDAWRYWRSYIDTGEFPPP